MNIFYLHHSYKKCAKMHIKQHVIKQILEYCQILSTVHHLNKNFDNYDLIKDFLYKPTHINHPSVKWVCESINHYKWLVNLTGELLKIFNKNRLKNHKCTYILKILKENLAKALKILSKWNGLEKLQIGI